MKRSTIGAALLLLIGAAVIAAWMWLRPRLDRRGRVAGSDARAAETIRIAGDGYLGYWFLRSPEMRKNAAAAGVAVEFTDDRGAYAERLQKFADKEYDAIVLPVNSYLEHGAAHDYPGVIVASLCESRGADGIVGFTDRFPEGKVGELNDDALRIVYTAGSPSAFLLDLTIVDFDLFRLRGSEAWRVEMGGSSEVRDRAMREQGDAFVMWEPDLSRALREKPGLKYLWGSDKFGGYIVDVLVVRRDFLKRHRDAALRMLEAYFRSLRSYAGARRQLLTEIKRSDGIPVEDVERILAKIDWHDLQTNASSQFGLSVDARLSGAAAEGIVNTTLACTDVLQRAGRLSADPLGGNPYLILHSGIIEELAKRQPRRVGGPGAQERSFAALDPAAWDALRSVGTMRVEPIGFQAGRDRLDPAGKDACSKIADLLTRNYADYRILIKGHTGRGDAAANLALSQARAESVAQYLATVHGVARKRMRPTGLGSQEPPERRPGEGARAFRYRMARVEFELLEDNAL